MRLRDVHLGRVVLRVLQVVAALVLLALVLDGVLPLLDLRLVDGQLAEVGRADDVVASYRPESPQSTVASDRQQHARHCSHTQLRMGV